MDKKIIELSDEESIEKIDNIFFEDEMQKEFLRLFDYHFNKTLQTLYFNQIQMNIGHRLRPRMVYWGYVVSNASDNIKHEDLDMAAKIAVCIELIHKSSIMLDDMIDKDITRHGKPTFHTVYGAENTILFSLNILSVSLMNLNSVFLEKHINSTIYGKSMMRLIDTMYQMSLGCLQEQNLDEKTIEDTTVIRDIMKKETAALLTNSLLLGHYISGCDNSEVEERFFDIGNDCGYCFQAMNDLEPFSNSEKNISHKGSINTDIVHNKKNIAVAILLNMISPMEKIKLRKENESSNIYILELYEKYKIQEIIVKEVTYIQSRVQENISQLKKYNINQKHCDDFFLLSIRFSLFAIKDYDKKRTENTGKTATAKLITAITLELILPKISLTG